MICKSCIAARGKIEQLAGNIRVYDLEGRHDELSAGRQDSAGKDVDCLHLSGSEKLFLTAFREIPDQERASFIRRLLSRGSELPAPTLSMLSAALRAVSERL